MSFSLDRPWTGRFRSTNFEIRGQRYDLTRLGDRRYQDLGQSSIAIAEDLDLALFLHRRATPTLAEAYAACRHLFGERGRCFDAWKGGFAFPFALEVPRSAPHPAYLLNVINYRDRLAFHWSKLVDSSDRRLKDPLLYAPDADDFPRTDMRSIACQFVGCLDATVETLASHWRDRFLLAVESNLILFGFDDGFFSRGFESHEEFEATRAALAQQLPTPGFYPDD